MNDPYNVAADNKVTQGQPQKQSRMAFLQHMSTGMKIGLGFAVLWGAVLLGYVIFTAVNGGVSFGMNPRTRGRLLILGAFVVLLLIGFLMNGIGALRDRFKNRK
jgi:hypothetical protein